MKSIFCQNQVQKWKDGQSFYNFDGHFTILNYGCIKSGLRLANVMLGLNHQDFFTAARIDCRTKGKITLIVDTCMDEGSIIEKMIYNIFQDSFSCSTIVLWFTRSNYRPFKISKPFANIISKNVKSNNKFISREIKRISDYIGYNYIVNML